VKRSLALLAAVAVVATPLAASAAPKAPKKTTRVVTFDYTVVRGVAGTVVLNGCEQVPGGCMEFFTEKGEKAIAFKVEDATGQPVAIDVYPDADYNANSGLCGTGTYKVSPKRAVGISVRPVASPDCEGVPTTGTITATITNF
jgi:hypothetical protein